MEAFQLLSQPTTISLALVNVVLVLLYLTAIVVFENAPGDQASIRPVAPQRLPIPPPITGVCEAVEIAPICRSFYTGLSSDNTVFAVHGINILKMVLRYIF